MANENDSFIDEVTEDLRRDRLFGMFRRYGWIAIAVIVLIVAGAAWREYSRAQDRAAAQAFGDAVLAAQAAEDPAAALAGLNAEGGAGREALAGVLQANALAEAGDAAAAAERLTAVATGPAAKDVVMRDLALLKSVLVQGEAMDPAQRDQVLAQLAQPGAPFELLALEQQAVALIGAGRPEDAVTLIRQIQQKDGLSEPLRRRLSEMMIAMGVEPEPTDTTPASE
ncbi:MAG: tetratricopeptide repeat protein [Paracoccus sp. (in: a-proteobacteria)]